jgi:hypothetical protein
VVALHRWPRFPFPHLQRNLSMTLSLLQSDMLLSHLGQSISPFESPHSRKDFMCFSWSENKNPKNNVVGKPPAPTTPRPEWSFRDERQVLHFVLLSLDHIGEGLRHVVVSVELREKKGTDIIVPQIDGKRKLILFYRTFTSTLTQQRNSCTRTVQQESVKAATGYGHHR